MGVGGGGRTPVSSLAVTHSDLCFCVSRSLMGLEPNPRCATNYPPSGVSWTVSLPWRGLSRLSCLSSLGEPGLTNRRLGLGEGQTSHSTSRLFCSHHCQPLLQD